MGLCASCCRKKVIDFSTQTSPIIPTPVPSPVLTSRSKYEAVWTPFNEPAFSIYEQSKSIVGFENEKCSTLEQALHPFHGEIESLTEQIERAKAECYPRRANIGNSESISSPAEKSDRITLTHDQSAAIYLYTMREHKSSVYSHLQDALKSGEIVKIQKWFKYLNLLKSALNRLPSSKGKLYQTVVAKKEVHRLKSEMITIYSCLGSASSTADLPTKQFVKEHPGEKMMQVIYDNVDSYDISKFSANTYDEYLIWPGMRWYIYKLETLRSKIIIYITSAMDHFACPTAVCPNRCSRRHGDDSRCDACLYLIHNYKHLCKPSPRCFHGGSEQLRLFECKKCHGKFCEECSMRGNDPSIFRCQPPM